MFNFAPKIEGKIGFYHLGDWWLAEFTEAERNYIEAEYSPMGADDNTRPLTQGKILGSTGRAAQFLWGLATWFRKPSDYQICERILIKAEQVAQDPVDLHFTYQQMIEIYYRARGTDPTAIDRAIDACKKQINLSTQVSRRMKKEFPDADLPSHVGYKQLSIIFEKQKKYTEALELLKQAHTQGWNGDWEKRIARCEKKISR